MSQSADQVKVDRAWTTTFFTPIALALLLIGYPAFRMAVAYGDLFPASDAAQWWNLWGVVLVGHWICAAIVLTAIAGERATLASIGLDVGVFIRRRALFLIVLVFAAGAAIYAPGYFYGETLPSEMRSHPLGPVTSAQRFFWIAMAVTAGFVEEIVFRGYAITRLRRFVGLPAAMAISIAAFALMHGPSAFIPQFAALYLFSGSLFAGLFILMKSRRLEILIIVHIALDMLLVSAP